MSWTKRSNFISAVILPAVLCLLAGGCAIDEKKEVAQYRQILDGLRAHGVHYVAGDPLSLQAALALANQNNEQLAISGETYIQALINKDRATANFLPTISLAPTYVEAEHAGGGGGSSSVSFATGGIGAAGGNTGFTGSTGSSAGGLGGNNVGNVGTVGVISGTSGTIASSGSTATTVTPALARPTKPGSGTAVAGKPIAAKPTLVRQSNSGGSTGILASKRQALDVPLNGKINLFNGFRDTAYFNYTLSEIERNRKLLLDLQMQVMLDTSNTYYAVISNERSVTVLQANVKTQEENVRLIRGQQVAGVAKPSDVAQAESQAAQTRASLVSAEANVRNARSLLAFLTSAPVDEAPLTDQMGLPASLPGVEAMIQAAEYDRQDLGAAVSGIESARHALQVAVGEYYPSINLSVNYYLSKQSVPTANQWNILLDAVQPIFDAGLIRDDVRTALSELRQAKLNEAFLRRQVREQVLTAYENLVANSDQLKELVVAVDAAREALRVAAGLYRFGNGLFLDVLVAQDQLLSAQLSLETARVNRSILYLTLLREVGRLTRPPGDLITTAPTTNAMAVEMNARLPVVNENGPPIGTAPSDLQTQPATLPDATMPTTLPVTLPSTGNDASEPAPTAPNTRPAMEPLRIPPSEPTTRPLGVGEESVNLDE